MRRFEEKSGVIAYLKKVILSNQYKLGDPISESVVCGKLGVSRAPVREAFKLLEKENLLKIYPKRGAFITSISLEKIQEIYQIRELVEGVVACLVAPETHSNF